MTAQPHDLATAPHVLVVDDEAAVRRFLVESLRSEGYNVAAASDGFDALAMLRRQRFSVVVTDLKMPGADGLTLLQRIRDDFPGIETILLTAHGTVDTAVRAMKDGAYDFLQKPLASPAEIRTVVAGALDRVAARNEDARANAELPPVSYGAPASRDLETMLRRIAQSDVTVLLTGETGSGKEIAARTLHASSRRTQSPFIAVNCAAFASSLIESELFGHERGAFTGAVARRRGKLELADGGTFFLDEIGELPIALQAKLLRVLQERAFERVGGNTPIRVDVRIIAATHRDLRAMVRSGEFREDLYHRIAVLPVRVPSLNERRADIAGLSRALLAQLSRELQRDALTLTPAALAHLTSRDYPGNVRELRNLLHRAAIFSTRDTLDVGDIEPQPVRVTSDAAAKTLAELEREAIEQALLASDGNRKRAAERLGIGVRTLYEKLQRYRMEDFSDD